MSERVVALTLVVVAVLGLYLWDQYDKEQERLANLKTQRQYFDECLIRADAQGLSDDIVMAAYQCGIISVRACQVRGCKEPERAKSEPQTNEEN